MNDQLTAESRYSLRPSEAHPGQQGRRGAADRVRLERRRQWKHRHPRRRREVLCLRARGARPDLAAERNSHALPDHHDHTGHRHLRLRPSAGHDHRFTGKPGRRPAERRRPGRPRSPARCGHGWHPVQSETVVGQRGPPAAVHVVVERRRQPATVRERGGRRSTTSPMCPAISLASSTSTNQSTVSGPA